MNSNYFNFILVKRLRWIKKAILFTIPLLLFSRDSFAQDSIRTEYTITKVILNNDTLLGDTLIVYLKVNQFNRTVIWEKDSMLISAVCLLEQKGNEKITKIRFDKWDGTKWKKPRKKIIHDGLFFSINRWSTCFISEGSSNPISMTLSIYDQKRIKLNKNKNTIVIHGNMTLYKW